ncbi:peptidase G2 autoproteolytic cleavage domain-containing protein [Bacillus subtilis]
MSLCKRNCSCSRCNPCNMPGPQGPPGTTCIRTDPGNGCSVAEGTNTFANGFASHSEGFNSKANGDYSHAEGINTQTAAAATAAHSEGSRTTASGFASHAEGLQTTASGLDSHAEGFRTTASGFESHAEGFMTNAGGFASHAEGRNTSIISDMGHAEGDNTTVINTGAHIMGRNGATRFPFSWHLANGLAVGPTSNSAVIQGATGNLFLDGTIFMPAAADFAEMFETIDVGYFVTLEGKRIRKASSNDDDILGITSATPAVLTDSCELRWKVTDEWGRVQYHEVDVPEEIDDEGRIIQPGYTVTEPKLNPKWDSTKEYIPRSQRPEWVAVGLLGKLLVRDDGTCEVNSYCKSNDEGIATKANQGYRVLERTGPNQVLVLVK